MALLLAMFQKFRLIRERNQLVLNVAKFGRAIERIADNITQVQKRYTSIFSQLDSRAQRMQSQATMIFQNRANLGCGMANVNPYSFNGINGFVMNSMAQMLFGKNSEGVCIGYNEDKTPMMHGLDESTFREMMEVCQRNGGRIPTYKDGETIRYGEKDGKEFDEKDYKAFNAAQSYAMQNQQQAQYQVQQLSTNYATNVSIWLEAEKARLEDEQNEMLEPLNYKQTMMELDKEHAEAKLERINQQIESYDRLCSEDAKNSAPSFGLG